MEARGRLFRRGERRRGRQARAGGPAPVDVELARARRQWLAETLPRNARRPVALPVGPGAEALASIRQLLADAALQPDEPSRTDAA